MREGRQPCPAGPLGRGPGHRSGQCSGAGQPGLVLASFALRNLRKVAYGTARSKPTFFRGVGRAYRGRQQCTRGHRRFGDCLALGQVVFPVFIM